MTHFEDLQRLHFLHLSLLTQFLLGVPSWSTVSIESPERVGGLGTKIQRMITALQTVTQLTMWSVKRLSLDYVALITAKAARIVRINTTAAIRTIVPIKLPHFAHSRLGIWPTVVTARTTTHALVFLQTEIERIHASYSDIFALFLFVRNDIELTGPLILSGLPEFNIPLPVAVPVGRDAPADVKGIGVSTVEAL